jgi:hypothetical protein
MPAYLALSVSPRQGVLDPDSQTVHGQRLYSTCIGSGHVVQRVLGQLFPILSGLHAGTPERLDLQLRAHLTGYS